MPAVRQAEGQRRLDQASARRGPRLVGDRLIESRRRFAGPCAGQRPRAPGQQRRRGGREAKRVLEGRGGSRRVPQRQQDLGVGGDRPGGGRLLRPGLKTRAKLRGAAAARQLNEPPGQPLVLGTLAERLLGALDERPRSVAMDLPVRARRPRRHDRHHLQGRENQPARHPSKVAPPPPRKTADNPRGQ